MSMRQVHKDNKDKPSTKILAFSSKKAQILISYYPSQNSIFVKFELSLSSALHITFKSKYVQF
jgi:hypothetical protein